MTADHVPTVPGLTGLSVLARGGYATVFRATQESVGRLVAVKVENRILENERDQRRFMREARAAGRMSSHPHVVDLFDAGVTPSGHPYLIMELCRGSYSERMRRAPLPPAEARDVGVKIADALADAHDLGVLHRDVKPANILETDFGEPALADFGLAILTENRDISITLDVLTPAYAPPEMFRHAPPAPPADVYALSATLYALMAGRPPRWPGSRDPSLVSLVDMFEDPIADLPHVPRELMGLILRGMSNVEAERPTAVELRDRLLAMEVGVLPAHSLTPELLPPPPPPYGPRPVPGGPEPRTVGVDEPTHVVGAGLPPAPPVPGGVGVRSASPRIEPPRRTPRRARLLWAGVAAVYLAALGALIAAALYVDGEPTTTFVARPAQSSAACALTPAGTAQCVREAECFNALAVQGGVARAPSVACTEPHVWEVFATAALPEGLDTASHSRIKQNAEVRQVCSTANVQALNTEQRWDIEVLPPTRDQLRAGDRTYRCLAGDPPRKLTDSRFVP